MASAPSSPPSLAEWFITRLNNQVVPRDNKDVDSGAINTLLGTLFRLDRGNWMVVPRGKGSPRTVQTYTRDPTDPDMTMPSYGAKVTTRSLECPDLCVVRMVKTWRDDIPNLAVLVKTLWESEEQAILTLVKWIETSR